MSRYSTRFTPAQRQHLLNWIEMLRSGQFRQTRGQLKRVHGGVERYCCLGVACELYSVKVGGFWNRNDFFADVLFDGTEDDIIYEDLSVTNSTELPDRVLNWFGLTADEQGQLAEWNDARMSFNKIADTIETLLITGKLPATLFTTA
jgi:hypothetical protein